MKTRFLVVALTIGLPAAAMTGNAMAGNVSANGADPEGAFIHEWVGHGAIETGALPQTSNGAGRIDRTGSGNAESAYVEIGGLRYRVGLDTGS